VLSVGETKKVTDTKLTWEATVRSRDVVLESGSHLLQSKAGLELNIADTVELDLGTEVRVLGVTLIGDGELGALNNPLTVLLSHVHPRRGYTGLHEDLATVLLNNPAALLVILVATEHVGRVGAGGSGVGHGLLRVGWVTPVSAVSTVTEARVEVGECGRCCSISTA